MARVFPNTEREPAFSVGTPPRQESPQPVVDESQRKCFVMHLHNTCSFTATPVDRRTMPPVGMPLDAIARSQHQPIVEAPSSDSYSSPMVTPPVPESSTQSVQQLQAPAPQSMQEPTAGARRETQNRQSTGVHNEGETITFTQTFCSYSLRLASHC